MKQIPRPAYHRRNDLRRLQELALVLPVAIIDAGHHYAVIAPGLELHRGRYEVVHAYLTGWIDGRRFTE